MAIQLFGAMNRSKFLAHIVCFVATHCQLAQVVYELLIDVNFLNPPSHNIGEDALLALEGATDDSTTLEAVRALAKTKFSCSLFRGLAELSGFYKAWLPAGLMVLGNLWLLFWARKTTRKEEPCVEQTVVQKTVLQTFATFACIQPAIANALYSSATLCPSLVNGGGAFGGDPDARALSTLPQRILASHVVMTVGFMVLCWLQWRLVCVVYFSGTKATLETDYSKLAAK